MDREAPASLLWCPSIARREARGPVWGGVRRGPVRLVGLSSGYGADQVPEGGVGVVGGGEVGAVSF